jgi:hypothetical protein
MFQEYDAVQVRDWIRVAATELGKHEEVWHSQPSWWSSFSSGTVDNDYQLLVRLLETGWGGLRHRLSEMLPAKENEVSNDEMRV